MKHTEIIKVLQTEPSLHEITVRGWVRSFRSNRFIALNDGSTLHNLQCVVDFESFEENRPTLTDVAPCPPSITVVKKNQFVQSPFFFRAPQAIRVSLF